MNVSEAIAKGLMSTALLLDAAAHKKDEHEDHAPEDVIVESTTDDAPTAHPDGARLPVYTVKGAMGVSDYCYSWEGVMKYTEERFRFESPDANLPVVTITDERDQAGEFWLFTFTANGRDVQYKVQKWYFCNPNVCVSRKDRLVHCGFYPAESQPDVTQA